MCHVVVPAIVSLFFNPGGPVFLACNRENTTGQMSKSHTYVRRQKQGNVSGSIADMNEAFCSRYTQFQFYFDISFRLRYEQLISQSVALTRVVSQVGHVRHSGPASASIAEIFSRCTNWPIQHTHRLRGHTVRFLITDAHHSALPSSVGDRLTPAEKPAPAHTQKHAPEY